jgi:hypothetical protein
MSAARKSESYWEAVRRTVDQAPPIPTEARDKIALILRGGREVNGQAPRVSGTGPDENATDLAAGKDRSAGRHNGLLQQLSRLVIDGPAPAAQRLRVAADEAAGLIAAAGANRVTVVACLILAAEAAGLPRRDAEAILRKALHAGRPS